MGQVLNVIAAIEKAEKQMAFYPLSTLDITDRSCGPCLNDFNVQKILGKNSIPKLRINNKDVSISLFEK